MKRFIALTLCLVTVLLMCACGAPAATGDESTPPPTTEPVVEIDYDTPLCDGKTLKLLVISSSFGLNTTNFLYEIAKDQGCTNIVIGRLFQAECTLKMHVQNADRNAMAYRYYKKNSDADWTIMENISMEYGIKDEQWDIIFLQHSAEGGAQTQTYGDYIPKLMTYIDGLKTNPKARYVWNMTWAFPQNSTAASYVALGSNQMKHYEAIVQATKDNVIPVKEFVDIIPSGTAVQNVRTSYIGDTLNRDSMHLNELGYVIAGCMVYATLTRKPIESLEISAFSPTLTVREEQKLVILEAVNNALKTPYEVTQSAYTERPEVTSGVTETPEDPGADEGAELEETQPVEQPTDAT